MKNLKYLPIMLLSLLLGACGGGGNNSLTGDGGGAGAPGSSTAETLQIIASSPTLVSDQTGANFVTISAVVRDGNNNVMANENVLFSANTGSVEPVDNGITNEAGIAQALLKAFGDVSNRTITVNVSVPAAEISGSITVDVVGTTLQISGPTGVAQGDPAVFSAVLLDGESSGIANQTVMFTSANGNSFDNPAPVTDSTGAVQVTLTADGNNVNPDQITAEALGLTAVAGLTVSNDVFAFTTPAANTEVVLGANQTITVQWQQNGANVPDGSTIELSADRGTLGASSITTTGGLASTTINSSFAGVSTITATGVALGGTPIPDGPTTQLSIEFVADDPETVNVSAFPDNVVTQEQSTITAVVRDAQSNRVKGVTVDFNIVQDPSGGQLSVSSRVTDSQGIATTTYTAGGSATENDGVQISATVRQEPAVNDTVALTVAGRAINFVIGSGNSLVEVSPTRWGSPWSVTITDVTGAPVAGEELRLSLRSTHFGKGFWGRGLERWERGPSSTTTSAGNAQAYQVCFDEDWSGNPNFQGNENGSVEPMEDFNGNGSLEAGNIATIVATTCENVAAGDPGSTQQALQTDSAGAVELCVVYPKDYNTWVDVDLSATVSVDGGTESTESRFFQLPGLADDFNELDTPPPGVVSPFGVVEDCSNPN